MKTGAIQMSICLWILFSWAREAGNMESAYLAGEFTLLHSWSIVRLYGENNNKSARAVETAFFSIFTAYNEICSEFLGKNVLPYVDKQHAVSSAIRGSCGLDINLKLYDLLGRIGTDGLWAYWGAQGCSEDEKPLKEERLHEAQLYIQAIKALISNNPALRLPAKDDQAIDIHIAASLLATDDSNRAFIASWLRDMLERARFSYEANGKYPCVLDGYSDLLEHPKSTDNEYRENVTSGSILYPSIALWAALLDDDATYGKVAAMKRDLLQHCTFQFWYPDDRSEALFYTNAGTHGAALANLAIDRSKEEFLAQVFGECGHSPHFGDLSVPRPRFSWTRFWGK